MHFDDLVDGCTYHVAWMDRPLPRARLADCDSHSDPGKNIFGMAVERPCWLPRFVLEDC